MRLRDRAVGREVRSGGGRWPDWGWVALFWLALGGMGLFNACLGGCIETDGSVAGWIDAATEQLPPYLLWALLTPVVFWGARRFDLGSDRWIRTGLFHLVGAAAFVVVGSAYRAWIHDLLVHDLGEESHAWQYLFASGFPAGYEIHLFVYGALLGGVWALDAYREARERRRHEAQLQEELAQARYQALRMQIQPHFLFNTLNTVSALVERDPDATRRVVARLSDLLRRVLEEGQEQETTLHEELEFVRSYLEIEQIRYGDRLEVEFRVDPGLETSLVPTLVMQPLVENAIRHGIARSPWKGRITIEAASEDGELVLAVTDTGPGLDPGSPSRGAGMALENTRRRLEELYGADTELSLGPASSETGCRAEIRIPLRHRTRSETAGSRLADAG